MAKGSGGAKAGASQLAQLKSHFKSAGIDDRRQQSNAAKKRKRGQAGSEQESAAARREALARISSDTRFNPFDEKVTKLKHDVLGRKVKGAVGRPALAKQGAVAQRTATLLPEYRNRNKSGTFIDRRFGEMDESLTPEERMLERFTKEKQRQAKGKKAALFNLNDEDAEGQEEELTHYGRSLSAMGRMSEMGMPDQDDGQIDGLTTGASHFGGFEAEAETDDPDRKKSKAEVMREIMAKSKAHKLERQQMRDADDELRAQLDDDLGDIRGLLMDVGTSRPAEQGDVQNAEAGPSKPKGSDYDAFVRELAFERRAKPQERLKTEAEIAEEEAQQLRKAEEARLRRMQGEEIDEGEDEAGGYAAKRRRAAQADDLDDDFDMDEGVAGQSYGLGSGIGLATAAAAADDAAVEGSDDEVDGDDVEEDESSEGEQDSALEQDGFGEALQDEEDGALDSETEELAPRKAAKAAARSAKGSPSALPFTFECPTVHSDFIAMLQRHDIGPAQVPLVLKRIRTLYHPSLAEDNKYKLQAFIGVLLDHSLYCATEAAAAPVSSTERAIQVNLMDHLLRHLFDLTTTYPIASSEHFAEKLQLMERNLTRGLSKGSLRPEARTWPGAAELTLLRIAGMVWPTSDQNHAIATPLALLQAHYLAHARVRSYADLASGLFLVSLVLQQQEEAKRMVPEAINFLQNALMILSPLDRKGADKARKACADAAVPTPDFGEEHVRHLGLVVGKLCEAEPRRPDFFGLVSATNQVSGEQTAVDLLAVTFTLVVAFSELYAGTSAYIELFTPFKTVLECQVASTISSQSLLDLRASTLSHLTSQLSLAQSCRLPLRLHAHKAIPLASFIPKFDAGGRSSRHGGSHFDPDSARAESAKLRALIKKERKGAVRELRKDSQFLAQARAEDRLREDKEYQRKIGKIVSGLGEERSEEKKYEREKERLRRRRGK